LSTVDADLVPAAASLAVPGDDPQVDAGRAPGRGLGRLALGLAPGFGLVVPVAAAAWEVGRLVPVVGGPASAIILGMVVAAVRPAPAAARPGIDLVAKQALQVAIVLLGTGLSLASLVRTGTGSLPVMLGTLAAALGGAWLFGRALGVRGDLATLIGVGTGVCGGSAIAAASSVLGAGELDIAYSMSTIFLFNVVAVLLYPPIGHLLGMAQHAFGLWAGTAINDTSSVVAAAYTYGPAAGSYAVIVKLTRSTAILPITLALALWRARGQRRAGTSPAGATAQLSWRRVFPWFILFFVLASVANTAGVFSPTAQHDLSQAGLLMIILALAAIGLSARFGAMLRTGHRPLLLGLLLWATVGTTSLVLQHLTGKL